ncbi:DUF4383 domain-containing protein [Pseudonocardiaceae bacterium YIM PH 21723]|nr:DUF4383 domain-containing protein [Pseudonocardiaceae bacterium YIM PH 21723]
MTSSGVDRYLGSERPLRRNYRVVVALFGAALAVFGFLGIGKGAPLFTSDGATVWGLSTNGALACLSVVVGGLLVISAIAAIMPTGTVYLLGGLFLLSGLLNLILMNTQWNVFAFRMPNVLFSFAAGLALLFVGTYGREPKSEELDSATEDRIQHRIEELEPLAEAEHAMAEGEASPEQERMVLRDAEERARHERAEAYRRDAELPGQRSGVDQRRDMDKGGHPV